MSSFSINDFCSRLIWYFSYLLWFMCFCPALIDLVQYALPVYHGMLHLKGLNLFFVCRTSPELLLNPVRTMLLTLNLTIFPFFLLTVFLVYVEIDGMLLSEAMLSSFQRFYVETVTLIFM